MPGARIRKDVLRERGQLVAVDGEFSIWVLSAKSPTEWKNVYVRRETKGRGRSTFRFAHNGKRFSRVSSVTSLKSDLPDVFRWVERELKSYFEASQ